MFFEQMHYTWQLALGDTRELLMLMEMDLIVSGRPYAPIEQRVMRAFQISMDDVKVLLVGQDPYPTVGHAIGLSFAVSSETKPLPRSLTNILRELGDDLGKNIERNGDLTVPIGEAGGHFSLGWTRFTDRAVAALAERQGERLVAMLWGKEAQSLEPLLGEATIIKNAHPSPLSASRGFFGSKPYSKANAALRKLGRLPVDWSC